MEIREGVALQLGVKHSGVTKNAHITSERLELGLKLLYGDMN